MTQPTQEEWLEEMRANWRVTIEGDGGYCPCCSRWGKVYRRSLNKTMARSLMWLVFQAQDRGDGWVHVPSEAPAALLRNSQLSSLKMWGLVECMPGADNGTKLASSGLWKATRDGVLFAQNKMTVQKYVYVYNDTVVDRDGEDVAITECLGDKYNYEDITANFDGTEKFEGDYDGRNA